MVRGWWCDTGYRGGGDRLIGVGGEIGGGEVRACEMDDVVTTRSDSRYDITSHHRTSKC